MKAVKFRLISLLLLMFTLIYCTPKPEEKEELNQLQKTIDEFYEAINSGNTDKRLDMFTSNAIIMPNNGELIEFTDSIRAIWKSYDKDWIFRIKDLKHIEIVLHGNMAYTVNTYYYTFHRKDSEPAWYKTKNVHIWKKQDDGNWKLHVDIWNSNSPPEYDKE